MKHTESISAIFLILCLTCSACNVASDGSRTSKIPDSYTITTTTSGESESSASSQEDKESDGIKWTMEDIQMLNDISKASVYSVTCDLEDAAITDEMPAGYTYWNGNATTLYNRGFYADMVIGRDTYTHTANSQKFIDINELPEEVTLYAKGYDLLGTAEEEEYLQDEGLEKLLKEVGIPTDNIRYPIRHILIRQQIDGIPTMPLRGRINTEGGKLSYGDYIKQGGTWTFSQSPVDIFDGEYAIEYLLIPKLNINEAIAKDQDVLPFEEVKDKLKVEIKKSIINDGDGGRIKNKLEDVTVTAAEVCYVMIYDNYAEPDKSSNCFLVPFWAVYYKCGIESGLTQQGAAFIPAVEGIYE